MGRILTPKYRIEENYRGQGYAATPAAWRGRIPTAAQLEHHVMGGIVAQYPGYVNEHISKAAGKILVPQSVRVVRQSDNTVVAEWKAPAFLALPEAKDYPEVAKSPVSVRQGIEKINEVLES